MKYLKRTPIAKLLPIADALRFSSDCIRNDDPYPKVHFSIGVNRADHHELHWREKEQLVIGQDDVNPLIGILRRVKEDECLFPDVQVGTLYFIQPKQKKQTQLKIYFKYEKYFPSTKEWPEIRQIEIIEIKNGELRFWWPLPEHWVNCPIPKGKSNED